MAVMLVTTFAASFVLAEINQSFDDDEQELQLDEEVTDGQITWKRMGLWFTFNQERKAEKELELARLRLIQAKVAARNNNSDAMEKALEAHEKILERVKERISKLESKKDISDLNESSVKLTGLERAIQVHERRINFLNNLLENANLTDDQRAKIELRIAKAQNVTARLSELNEEKRDRVKTRLMIELNMTEDEAEQFIEDRTQKRERSRDSESNLSDDLGDDSEDDLDDDQNSEDESDDSGDDSDSDLNDSDED